MVGSHQEVLDLGCGTGAMAAELKKDGNRTSGVDMLPSVFSESLEQYFTADLDQGIGTVIEALKGKRFDRVLLLDILEHLRRPEQLLEQCRQVLQRDGLVIISL